MCRFGRRSRFMTPPQQLPRAPLCTLGHGHDFGSEPNRNNNKQFTVISTDNQCVSAVEPFVEFAEPVPAAFHFTAQISTEQGDADVATEAPACSPTERYTLSRKTALLQEADDGALGAIALVTRCTTAM